MLKACEQETNSPNTSDRLDQIRMSPDKRRRAQTSMQQAEFIADLFVRANDDLRSLFDLFRRGISVLTRRTQASAASPELRLP